MTVYRVFIVPSIFSLLVSCSLQNDESNGQSGDRAPMEHSRAKPVRSFDYIDKKIQSGADEYFNSGGGSKLCDQTPERDSVRNQAILAVKSQLLADKLYVGEPVFIDSLSSTLSGYRGGHEWKYSSVPYIEVKSYDKGYYLVRGYVDVHSKLNVIQRLKFSIQLKYDGETWATSIPILERVR